MRNSLSCSQVQQDNSHHTMNRPKWSKLWDVAACCCTSVDTTLRLDGESKVQESAPFESFLGLEPFPKIRAFLQSPRSNSTCTATQSGSLAEHPGVHGSGAKHQNAFFEGRRGGSICRWGILSGESSAPSALKQQRRNLSDVFKASGKAA